MCHSLASAGRADVENFDVHRVSASFLSEIAKVAPALKVGLPDWAVGKSVGMDSIPESNEVLHGG